MALSVGAGLGVEADYEIDHVVEPGARAAADVASGNGDDAMRLAGPGAAFDEVVAIGLERQYPVALIVGDMLKTEIAETQAHSI